MECNQSRGHFSDILKVVCVCESVNVCVSANLFTYSLVWILLTSPAYATCSKNPLKVIPESFVVCIFPREHVINLLEAKAYIKYLLYNIIRYAAYQHIAMPREEIT